jgi:hypothetical protein
MEPAHTGLGHGIASHRSGEAADAAYAKSGDISIGSNASPRFLKHRARRATFRPVNAAVDKHRYGFRVRLHLSDTRDKPHLYHGEGVLKERRLSRLGAAHRHY